MGHYYFFVDSADMREMTDYCDETCEIIIIEIPLIFNIHFRLGPIIKTVERFYIFLRSKIGSVDRYTCATGYLIYFNLVILTSLQGYNIQYSVLIKSMEFYMYKAG